MKGFKSGCVYIAPLDRVAEVKEEIENIVFEKDNFLVASRELQKSYWAQNIWENVKIEKIESIKKASLFLRGIQRNWWHFPLNSVRRGTLIQESLPRIKNSKLQFPAEIPTSPLGAFALLSETELLYSPNCSSPLPNGEFHFLDPKHTPPSGAYLKLWEALTRLGVYPNANDFCVDIGSSPGSWTEALLNLGARVLSVDKADLEIPDSKLLSFKKMDAFKLDPKDLINPHWIFSDIICFPDKLYELALSWKNAHPKAKFIFTIKFQGPWNMGMTKKFSEIPDSKVLHLFNNKHELCWMSGFNG